MRHALRKDIFKISSDSHFESASLRIFRYQAENNPVYSEWLKELGCDYKKTDSITDIPFIPVSLFRDHKIFARGYKEETVFTSSGTTGSKPGNHFIADISLYETSFTECFRLFYGSPCDYVILALLPSYLEREGSSLVYMADRLISMSGSGLSGFFLYDYTQLKKRIDEAGRSGKKILLLGVSFALLDIAERGKTDLSGNIVMETGGMKGRGKEITREELHSVLKDSFNLENIHSEYGMTELLSQAYSSGDGIYRTPPWMRVLIRDPYDPFSYLPEGRTGGVNIIDLANIYSCSFIETSDLGILHTGGSFEITGRFDNSDIRGCNLMIS